jgi:hypothetical protein
METNHPGNAYCQDNETSWYDWNCLEQHRDIVRFTRGMIAFRRAQGTALGRSTKLPPEPSIQRHTSGSMNGPAEVAGHVEDVIIDDETWAIRYLIIDTRNWWPGKKLLVSPQWIERVSWSESKVFVTLPRETIRQSPEYWEESRPTRAYETGPYLHYNRLGYWIEEPAAKEHSR